MSWTSSGGSPQWPIVFQSTVSGSCMINRERRCAIAAPCSISHDIATKTTSNVTMTPSHR